MMIKKCFISVLIVLVFILSVTVIVSASPDTGGGIPPAIGPPRGMSIILTDEIVECPELPPVCVYPTEEEGV